MKSGFVEKSAEDSHLMALIRHEDEPRMPFKKPKLSDSQIASIGKWIDLGAPYDKPLVEKSVGREAALQVTEADRDFWSFRRLDLAKNAEPPSEAVWVRNAIDRFIIAKHRERRVRAAPEADRRTLIRRASLDLLGLPPSPEDVDAFVRDADPLAYNKMIDRLLQSPHYGERWARHWMDVARFAESSGFEHDYDRPTAYHYRDFLIEAFNQDVPWDVMTRWQLAGDELDPENPLALKATGFLAAGVFPTQLTEVEFESARYDELDDMIGTMGVAFLGLSTGCARCHDHKFDPIPTRDYYALAAAFATTIRAERQVEIGSQSYQASLAEWTGKSHSLRTTLEAYEKQTLTPRFTAWLKDPKGLDGIASGDWWALDSESVISRDGATLTRQEDGAWLATGLSPSNDEYTVTAFAPAGAIALRVEALTHESLTRRGPGRAGNGNFALGNLTIKAQAKGTDAETQAATVPIVDARATHEQNQGNLSVKSSFDGDPNSTGWAVDGGGIGQDQAAVFVFDKAIEKDSRITIQMRFHVNTQHSLGRFRLALSDRADADIRLGTGASRALAEGARSLQKGDAPLTEKQRAALRAWFAARDAGWSERNTALQRHLAAKPMQETRTVMICSEGVKPLKHHADGRGYPHFYEQVHYLKRGDVKQKQGVAEAGPLQVLATSQVRLDHWRDEAKETSAHLSYRRARLARWMTDADQGAGHLLARVMVNRLWQHHFGRGIVATPNDFGLQGEEPTHPELLDWLAVDLIENGWKLKRVHRLIMTSATYRQSSSGETHDEDSWLEANTKADVENTTLWRYPSRRLEAEAIRDSLLFVSGQLEPTLYGPGSMDESMTRRSVYFKIKRSRPIPIMQVFDWPEHLVSIGDRASTTIAPQALALMNSSQVRRYAADFAKRIRPTAETSVSDAVRSAYLNAFSRQPTAIEAKRAERFIESQRARRAESSESLMAALTDLCQAMMGSNEFLYLP